MKSFVQVVVVYTYSFEPDGVLLWFYLSTHNHCNVGFFSFLLYFLLGTVLFLSICLLYFHVGPGSVFFFFIVFSFVVIIIIIIIFCCYGS